MGTGEKHNIHFLVHAYLARQDGGVVVFFVSRYRLGGGSVVFVGVVALPVLGSGIPSGRVVVIIGDDLPTRASL